MKVKSYRKGNRVIEIHIDESPQDPREWDNLGTMAYKHSKYKLGDVEIHGDVCDWLMELMEFKETRIEWWYKRHGRANNDLLNALFAELHKHFIWLPVYLYDHGNISVSTTSFRGRAPHAEWDSGMCGLIYVSKKKAKEEYKDYKDWEEKAKALLESEVKTFNEYASGDVYGFIVYDEEECDKGHIHKEEIDSCWGFFGSNFEENGLFDHALSENEKVEDFIEERK